MVAYKQQPPPQTSPQAHTDDQQTLHEPNDCI
jgi:hypothetical protein